MTDLPTKTIRVLHDDGSVWHLSGKAVAWFRADRLVGQSSTAGEKMDTTVEEEMRRALNDDDILLKWTRQELSWGDLREHATLVAEERPPRQMSTATCAVITDEQTNAHYE
ncbi:hypothetical protein [Salinibacter altiplanensis]|uniref:hypothetical protein n=1 Tax=Salinibacter altiplanensis TaxID=1803181 RepID=UPI000C9FC9F0|nr:hypothetical protein [Salinibacter altiplanensis]